jgi:hypothetical protein
MFSRTPSVIGPPFAFPKSIPLSSVAQNGRCGALSAVRIAFSHHPIRWSRLDYRMTLRDV